MSKLAPSPLDPVAAAVVGRLEKASKRQIFRAFPAYLPLGLKNLIRHRSFDASQSPEGKEFLADKMIALDPEKSSLCYLLCRSIGARRVIEVGTSYGVSTIYLAAAIRDNVAGTDESGVVYGTEHEPAKVSGAQRNLNEAGVADYAEVLAGDLRETLVDVAGPIDFVLVDIWIPMALPALELITPKLRPGALVVCDHVVSGATEYADYLAYVRDPDGPFTSITVPGQGGIEISMKK